MGAIPKIMGPAFRRPGSLIATGLIFLVISICCYFIYDFRGFLQQPLNIESNSIMIKISPGSSLLEIASSLEKQGILKPYQYFVLLAYWQGQEKKIRAGEYRLFSGLRPEALLQKLVEGKVALHGLTIIEGWTFRQVMIAVNQHDAIDHRLSGLSEIEIMPELGFGDSHPEGRFFPDTYMFPLGTTDIRLLKDAHQLMVDILQAQWKLRQPELPFTSSYDALILASIIERETALAKERPLVSGVFVRRLRHGMRLQTDPTVIYGLRDLFDGNLRREDLEQDTAYNTYLHSGLPPTPICMPGIDSIRAALNPAPGASLYFVARGDGSHHFSSSFEEHRHAVNEYQRKPFRSP